MTPKIAQLAEDARGLAGTVHQRGLGDLDAQVGRLQSGFLHRLLDDADEVLLHQLPAGDVDGDALEAGVRKPALPVGERAARLLHHPGAERLDQPELLGDRHERRRRDRLAVARPADQRLEPDAHPGRQRHDRLVVDLEVVGGDRAAQVVLEAEAVANAGVHVRVEHFVARLAARLGVIHRGVGVAHHLVRVRVVGRTERDADAGRGEHFAAADRERRAQRLLDPEGDAVGLAVVAESVQEDRELVAAEAGEHVALSQARLEPPRHRDQQLVADQVTEAVVDDLEAIEIEIEDRERGADAAQA